MTLQETLEDKMGDKMGANAASQHRAGRPTGRAALRLVGSRDHRISQERVFGSPQFINRTRNTRLESPARFEPTPKKPGDIIL